MISFHNLVCEYFFFKCTQIFIFAIWSHDENVEIVLMKTGHKKFQSEAPPKLFTTKFIQTFIFPPFEQNLRLSEFVTPIVYDLLIHPDLTPGPDNGAFYGNVKITLNVTEATEEIILHAHELTIADDVTFTATDPSIRVLVILKPFRLD